MDGSIDDHERDVKLEERFERLRVDSGLGPYAKVVGNDFGVKSGRKPVSCDACTAGDGATGADAAALGSGVDASLAFGDPCADDVGMVAVDDADPQPVSNTASARGSNRMDERMQFGSTTCGHENGPSVAEPQTTRRQESTSALSRALV